jgi:hypothetical protein
MVYIKKTTLAKFPSKIKNGKKKTKQIDNTTKGNDKRRQAINVFKPHPPANNGWWYYDLFSRDTFHRGQNQKKRR